MVNTRGAELFVRGGWNDGTPIALTKEMTTIGRSASNDIEVDAEGISRQHASIRRDTDGFFVSDLGSTNGTFVNGEQVGSEPRRLSDGDRIELGGMEYHWVFKEQESRHTVEIPRPKRQGGSRC